MVKNRVIIMALIGIYVPFTMNAMEDIPPHTASPIRQICTICQIEYPSAYTTNQQTQLLALKEIYQCTGDHGATEFHAGCIQDTLKHDTRVPELCILCRQPIHTIKTIIENQHLLAINTVMKALPDYMHETDKDGNNSLYYAAVTQNRLIIEKLLRHGVSPYKKNREGITPASLLGIPSSYWRHLCYILSSRRVLMTHPDMLILLGGTALQCTQISTLNGGIIPLSSLVALYCANHYDHFFAHFLTVQGREDQLTHPRIRHVLNANIIKMMALITLNSILDFTLEASIFFIPDNLCANYPVMHSCHIATRALIRYRRIQESSRRTNRNSRRNSIHIVYEAALSILNTWYAVWKLFSFF